MWTVEIPDLQVLEREPNRRAIPGHTEQRASESTRSRTVDTLLFLGAHTGRMGSSVLGATT